MSDNNRLSDEIKRLEFAKTQQPIATQIAKDHIRKFHRTKSGGWYVPEDCAGIILDIKSETYHKRTFTNLAFKPLRAKYKPLSLRVDRKKTKRKRKTKHKPLKYPQPKKIIHKIGKEEKKKKKKKKNSKDPAVPEDTHEELDDNELIQSVQQQVSRDVFKPELVIYFSVLEILERNSPRYKYHSEPYFFIEIKHLDLSKDDIFRTKSSESLFLDAMEGGPLNLDFVPKSIEKILDVFKENHKKYNYECIAWVVPKEKKPKNAKKILKNKVDQLPAGRETDQPRDQNLDQENQMAKVNSPGVVPTNKRLKKTNEKTIAEREKEIRLTDFQLANYWAQIFNHVIPKDLFGSRLNKQIIRQTTMAYLTSGKMEYFNFINHFAKIDLDKVPWLENCQCKFLKAYIFVKFIAWLLKKFVSSIVETYFFVESKLSHGKKIYYPKRRRNQLLNFYFEEQVKNRVIKKVESKEKRIKKRREERKKGLETVVVVSKEMSKEKADFKLASVDRMKLEKESLPTLSFYLKKGGVRPLTNYSSSSQPRDTHQKAQVIKQLIPKISSKIREFHDFWLEIAKKYKSKSEKLYYIVCDIQDAFGSIRQKKLAKILEAKVKKLPEPVSLHDLRILHRSHSGFYDFHPEHQLALISGNDYENLQLPPHSLAYSAVDFKLDKESILKWLQELILKQKVLYNNRVFHLKKGVAQGESSSSSLCEMYYEDMVDKYFTEFKNWGDLFRYVDDFLYLTNSKVAAQQFFQKISQGFPDYNCHFNPKKTKTNLNTESNDVVTFVGYELNVKSFEVAPVLPETPAGCQLFGFRPPRDKMRLDFKKRLKRSSKFKLNRFVLSSKINSPQTILDNIRKLALLHAKRCVAIFNSIFDVNYTDERWFINRTIEKSGVNMFIVGIKKIFRRNKNRPKVLNMWKIRSLVYAIYADIFQKYPQFVALANKMRQKAAYYKSKL